MTHLSKEYFDKQLKNLVTKADLEIQSQVLRKEMTAQTENLAILINTAFQTQKEYFEKRISDLEAKIDALANKLSIHIDLSDKRYLELKRRDLVITKWIKQVADKTGIKIDLTELEKF